MRSLLVLASALVLTACGSSSVPATHEAPAGLLFETDAAQYASGDEADFVLRNETDETYQMGVVGCALLQVREDGEWTTSPAGNDRVCIMMLQVLAPGETASGTATLDVPAGTYRFTHTLSEDDEPDEQVIVATAPFTVD